MGDTLRIHLPRWLGRLPAPLFVDVLSIDSSLQGPGLYDLRAIFIADTC